ncbi:MAG: thioredoxin family protein, partial [Polyangiaceae bacterium]
MARTRTSFLPAVGVGLITLAIGCRNSDKTSPTTTSPSGAASARTASAENGAAHAVQFIEDDYPRALAKAKATGKPIFADTWALWCHSCMSMKKYVLPAPEMQSLAGDFVWLSIDSENQANADFLERFPSTSIPTLWVIDPATEHAVLKWVGAATAPELVTL